MLTLEGAAAAAPNEEMYGGMSAAEALGKWVYHHRHELGLEIVLMTPNGDKAISPK